MSSVELHLKSSTYQRISSVLSSIFAGLSLIILVIWLLRDLLNLKNYANELIIFSIIFFAISQFVKWREVRGIEVAISFISKLGNIAIFSFFVIFIFSFFGLSRPFTDYMFQLLIGGIILKLASYVLYALIQRSGDYRIDKKTLSISPFHIMHDYWSIYSKNESNIVLIKRAGRKIGFFLPNDVNLEINNSLGKFNLKLKGPLFFISPFLRVKGKVSKDSLNILDKAHSMISSLSVIKPSQERAYVRLPFITVETDEFGERVRVGPINVRSEYGQEEVEIWPFLRVSTTDAESHSILYVVSSEPKYYVRITNKSISFRLNSDRFSFYGNGIRIKYLGYEFEILPNKIRVDAPEFKLNVIGNKIIFSSLGKSYSLTSAELANQLINTVINKMNEQINMSENIIYFDPITIIQIIKDVIERYGE